MPSSKPTPDLALANIGDPSLAAESRPLPGRAYTIHRPLRWPLIVTRMLIDITLINLAFTLAYYARYQLRLFRGLPEESNLPLSAFLGIQVGLTLVTLAVILGIWLVIFGVMECVLAWRLRSVR